MCIFQDGALTNAINIIDLSWLIPLISASSLDIRKSGDQNHERHDLSCFNLPSWTSGTMHTMWGSLERNLSWFYVQPSTLSTYHGLKSTNNTIKYFYSLTQHKRLTESAVVHQLKPWTPQTVILANAVLDGLGVMFNLIKCSPTLNGLRQNQQEAVVNACIVLMIECT